MKNFLEPEWISVWHLGKLPRQHPLKKRSYELVSSKVRILQGFKSLDSFQVFEYFLNIAKLPHQRGRGRRGGTRRQLFWLFREKLPRTSEFVGSPAIVGQLYFLAVFKHGLTLGGMLGSLTMRLTSGMKPMSNIRSASSSTKYFTAWKPIFFCFTKSSNLSRDF